MVEIRFSGMSDESYQANLLREFFDVVLGAEWVFVIWFSNRIKYLNRKLSISLCLDFVVLGIKYKLLQFI